MDYVISRRTEAKSETLVSSPCFLPHEDSTRYYNLDFNLARSKAPTVVVELESNWDRLVDINLLFGAVWYICLAHRYSNLRKSPSMSGSVSDGEHSEGHYDNARGATTCFC